MTKDILTENSPEQILAQELSEELDGWIYRLRVSSYVILGFAIALVLVDVLILVKHITNLITAEYLLAGYVLVILACIFLSSKLAHRPTLRGKVLVVFAFMFPAIVNGVSVTMYIDKGYPAEFSVYQICITLLWFNLAINRWTALTRIQKLNSMFIEDDSDMSDRDEKRYREDREELPV
uniref:Uncharacterized protein n=1 Tax=Corethron hystrix TaxID=216773 RepID=A0A7S1B4R9_9STRA|mmetsp:Transcript_12877/g.28434  ORF Transcript_12877/g.28434 Transcript_12877/m.28434 type:complete len:179 (+) Transcript_12877:280-816(+)|eukprot:CAMPEP_0113309468 /NCGR_PEP_ID=MMETSP0010_2-20120614/7500_1 /TAXON_ID=216773 ORGANISM="Corethron hystrix, Strain 308" /NCGR_SAMPLE_ID=MMETSP0010_2 /ASSEMBLY_ACC=CAM_ASM_000155 /LENGTH=178 /DNA_ID=CAMNT_0000164727 /DNA_START=253 /DNA_END=789 /DNA_ORIENTATION=+ /assembly_acc=CAM_ASM_000155